MKNQLEELSNPEKFHSPIVIDGCDNDILVSMFESMLSEIDVETIRILFSLQISTESELESINKQNSSQELKLEKEEINSDIFQNEKQATPIVKTNTVTRNEPKLGRNDLVKITNGQDTQEMKYKKAKPMIESGEWRLS